MAIAIGIVRLSPPLSSWLSSNHCVFSCHGLPGPRHHQHIKKASQYINYPLYTLYACFNLMVVVVIRGLSSQILNPIVCVMFRTIAESGKFSDQTMLYRNAVPARLKTATCQWSSFCCRVDAQEIISTKMVPQLWWQLARNRLMKWWTHCCKRVPVWTRVILMHGASHPFPFNFVFWWRTTLKK